MVSSNKTNNFCLIFFISVVCFLLWATSPAKAIPQCEKVNTQEFCNILNAE